MSGKLENVSSKEEIKSLDQPNDMTNLSIKYNDPQLRFIRKNGYESFSLISQGKFKKFYERNNGLVLGSGSFGQVYKCSNIVRKSFKHNKNLLTGATKEEIDRELMTYEAIRTSNVETTFLVRIIKVSFEKEIVEMEYCGISLVDFINNFTIQENIVIQILLSLSWGIIHLNSGGFIHRDLKPGNILVNYDLNTGLLSFKICDFGCASKNIHGTRGFRPDTSYVAPESKLTFRSDVCAIGLIIRAIMIKTIPPDIESNNIDRLLKKNFPRVYGVINRLMDDVPINRPDLYDVIKLFADIKFVDDNFSSHSVLEPDKVESYINDDDII